MNLKEKQISVVIILFSFLLIIYATVAKTSVKYTGEYEVDFIFFNVAYLRAFLFLLFTLGLGIFLFLFKDDKDVKAFFKSKLTGNIGKIITERKITALFLMFCFGLLAYTYYNKEVFKTNEDGVSWTKAYQHSVYKVTEVPLSLYEVDFLLFRIDYFTALYPLLILFGLAFIFFLKITDKQITLFIKGAKERKPLFLWEKMSGWDVKKNLKELDQIYKIFLGLLLPIIMFFLLLNYWQKLDESASPLSLWEAIFLSYGKTFFIVALATGALGVIKHIFSETKEKSKEKPRKQIKVHDKIPEDISYSPNTVKTPVTAISKKRSYEKTEIISLIAIVVFSVLSWIIFRDIFLLQQTYESILSIDIYNKVLAGDWNLGVGESALFQANLSAAKWEEFYGSDAPNVFVGLTVFFAFLFFARHVQKKKENRKKVLLVLTGAIVVITTLNFAFVEYTDIKRNEAIQYFHDTAKDLN